jgi:ElaB/YqjD/DUF883 family membrane-anchored ribosome-binding protein
MFASNGRTGEQAEETMDKVRQTAEEYADTARQKASDAAEAVKETASDVADRIQNSTVYTSACRMAREQPLATLAGVLAVGFMAGALWKLTRNQSTADRIASQLSSYTEPHLKTLRRNLWG